MPDGGNGAIVDNHAKPLVHGLHLSEIAFAAAFIFSASHACCSATGVSNDVGARGQATPEVTNSAISTRVQRVPSTSGPSVLGSKCPELAPSSLLSLIRSWGAPQAMGVSWKRQLSTYASKPMGPWIWTAGSTDQWTSAGDHHSGWAAKLLLLFPLARQREVASTSRSTPIGSSVHQNRSHS
eukprot:scaffold50399_cov86-Phaeocystis_antarctica.AAC.2